MVPRFWRPAARRPASRACSATLGGADPDSSTTAVVEAVERALPEAVLDVVIGPLFGPVPDSIDGRRAIRRGFDFTATWTISTLMAAADLAISGGARRCTSWRPRACRPWRSAWPTTRNLNIAALAGVPCFRPAGCTKRRRIRFRSIEEGMSAAGGRPRAARTDEHRRRALIDGQGAARVADVILRSGNRPRSIEHGPV